MEDLTLIIGAGASHELGLPLGSTLKDKIRTALSTKDYSTGLSGYFENNRIGSALHLLAEESHADGSEVFDAARRIGIGINHAISIDNLIDSHRGDKLIEATGKISIVECIASAEQHSRLALVTNLSKDFMGIDNCWLSPFVSRLFENCHWSNLCERLSRICFIIFNYDRCVEHYLLNAIISHYGSTADEAAALLNNVSFIHPYGTIGRLPWQVGSGDGMDFGSMPQGYQLLALSKQIRTFTEQKADDEKLEELRRKVAYSKRVVFLGFAYHKINMQLLQLADEDRQKSTSSRPTIGTAFGMSKADIDIVTHELKWLRASAEDPTIRPDLECRNVFTEYSRSLSFA
ncbi:hypothetical protein MUG10_04700 [Xanthomonas prunicola]|uniref:hypothetical protein n=1 Tax=Xanthomonas TaxID=338 RepID=UPI001BB0C125|nr:MULTISPECIES: hypothetical protein [Xanthomonas]QUI81246.1 hypothetical protein ICA18_02720 [Xanthomonas arboricola pv. corylina]USJ01504.1 hypothetical protein MUG10_04700 [Xanthomonas prunicola]